MKVYLVLERGMSGDLVLGVYRSRKAANEAKEVHGRNTHFYYVVESQEVIE